MAAPNPDWSDWIGRTSTATDILTPGMVEGLAATLESAALGDGEAPQGIHWLLAPQRVPKSGLGPDGHPARGGSMPPIGLPRRMWAASAVRFERPLRVGAGIERTSRIAAITPKQGSAGPLVFVEIDHEYRYRSGGTLAVAERQTVVYREVRPFAEPPPESPPQAEFERRVAPDPVMLFRYSALTFNGHRIHYDQPYATAVELYPGLVVHGPLTASLLIDLCSRQLGGNNRLATFAFRGVAPAFADETLVLSGRVGNGGLELAAHTASGRLVMTATASPR